MTSFDQSFSEEFPLTDALASGDVEHDAPMADAVERERAASRKVVAQIACEYVINYRDDGWDLRSARIVLDEARAAGVAPLYVDMLVDVIAELEARSEGLS